MSELVFPPWDELAPHQREALQAPQRFKVLVWHRRARKTTTAIIELVKQSQYRVGAYWHIFPTYSEAKDAVWRDPSMLFRIIPPELIKKKNEQELVVYFHNGSYLQLKGADEPDTLRGAGPVGIVFDEFAKVKEEAWYIVEPILRANAGWAWCIGTPKGKNHLYKFYVRGKQNHPEWNSWHLKASSSGIIPTLQLDESRKTMSESLYQQEYECAWLEGEGTVFRGIRDIMVAEPKAPDDSKLYVIGADLARLRDFTVLTVYDMSTNSQVYQDRFRGLEWGFQKRKIKELSDHYNSALVVLDATGVGDPIYTDLLRAGVPVEPFKITETTKKDLVEKLSIWIEQKKVLMLPIEQTIKELEDFTYKIGETGKVHYSAPGGEEFFDDCVISHALAVFKLQPLYREIIQKPRSRIGQYYDKIKGEMYEDNVNEREWLEWSDYN